MYAVKEIFLTVQGEGGRAGCRSVFLRMAGCNLWNGVAESRDKGKGACSRWCDTDFVGGEKMDAATILRLMDELWPMPARSDDLLEVQPSERWVVISGGEPTLQVDRALLDLLHGHGWWVAMETNGTADPEAGLLLDEVDWLTVSPKLGAEMKRWRGAELKVVLPGQTRGEPGWTDEQLEKMAKQGTWGTCYVQPQDPVMPESVGTTFLHGGLLVARAQFEANVHGCLRFLHEHPGWRLSLQTHKFIRVR